MEAFPAPETDWYVDTTTLLILYLECNGYRTITNCAVEQFGLLISLLYGVNI